MPNKWRVIILVSIILAPVLGYLIANWRAQAQRSGAFVRWQSLGSLPEKAVSIRGAIAVETLTGQVYICCWQKEDRTQDEFGHRLFRDVEPCGLASIEVDGVPSSSFFEVPGPPGPIVDCAEVVNYTGISGFFSQSRYVILEDGTVWKWDHSFNSAAIDLEPICGSGLGGILGAALLVILVSKWRKAQ